MPVPVSSSELSSIRVITSDPHAASETVPCKRARPAAGGSGVAREWLLPTRKARPRAPVHRPNGRPPPTPGRAARLCTRENARARELEGTDDEEHHDGVALTGSGDIETPADQSKGCLLPRQPMPARAEAVIGPARQGVWSSEHMLAFCVVSEFVSVCLYVCIAYMILLPSALNCADILRRCMEIWPNNHQGLRCLLLRCLGRQALVFMCMFLYMCMSKHIDGRLVMYSTTQLLTNINVIWLSL